MKKILQLFLSRQLQYLGCYICRHPLIFLVFPCIISGFLGNGMILKIYNRDIPNLITHEDGRAIRNERIEASLFPKNTSDYFDVVRLTNLPLGPTVYVTNTNSSSVLRKDCLEELEIFDQIVKNVKINHNGKVLGYSDLCAKKNRRCYKDPVISLLLNKDSLLSRRKKLKYPSDIDKITFSSVPYLAHLGGVTVDENGFVEDVLAFRLFYLMDSSNTSKIYAIREWTRTVIDKVKLLTFSSINVLPFSFSFLSEELKEISESTIPLTAAVIAVVGVFSFLTSLTSSRITSKPWLGISAIISAGLALISSFGLLSYFRVPITDFHIGIPFLTLGTEVDDAYVLIATWRKTNSNDTVTKRMGDTFAEAGVSITITSLTNVLSCCIGLISPFPGIRYFCIYGAVSLTFTYVYMITFFGACMAVDGYRENKLLDAITFKKHTDKTERKSDTYGEINTMKFFKDVIGKQLERKPVKIVVILLFVGNLTAGTYGLFQLQDGLYIENTLSSDSVSTKALTVFYRHFTKYFGGLHIIINAPLNYSDPLVQDSIENMIQKFKAHPKIDNYSEYVSWLHYYKMFQNLSIAKFSLGAYNLSVEEDFVSGLHDVFLRFKPTYQFKYDIKFNANNTKILASRFIISIVDINSKRDEYEIVNDMWKLAEESNLPIIVHSNLFPLIEQGILIRSVVFQITWITSLLILLVFLAFISNFLTALMVSMAVVSVLIETVGYAALWGVNLDIISMSTLVISVGFSINYPSHMAYAFAIAKGESSDDKTKESLYHVGLPILQGSLSTIFSSSLFLIKDSYATITFAKLVSLIAVQTAFHAMLVLPVVLNLCYVLENSLKSKISKIRNSKGEWVVS